MDNETKTVAVIVAHPDDETLWAGGTILSNPQHYFVVCLCRKSDPDRAPKFEKALLALGCAGAMGDLNDGPEQVPLSPAELEKTISDLLPMHFDRIITHSLFGEYTRHRRHEETGAAVLRLWEQEQLNADELWFFSYEDGGKAYLPVADERQASVFTLPASIWKLKYEIITNIYGFNKDSWEARTTPKKEAFRQFFSPAQAHRWAATQGALTP